MSSNMSLLQAINELPLNTDGTASLYASYLKKFSLFVTCNPLGIQSIRDLTRLVNERLPIHLQLT